jgi:small subunit ribosomal protein S1
MECDPRRKRLVISRRKVQEREREAAREQIAGSLQPGDEVQGKVTRLEPFGAFVDLGGVDGMVHISQLSRKRVEKVDEVVKIGDLVRAKVLEVKQGGKRISLSMRALEPDPWEQVGARYTPETVVQGKVVRLMDFGAFVELEPGLEGLLHVSQMLGGGQRVNRPGDVLRVGDAVSVRVIAADLSKHKLSLSRLDERGAVLGSEEAVDAAEIEQLVRDSRGAGTIGTNLGSLFKKALEKR